MYRLSHEEKLKLMSFMSKHCDKYVLCSLLDMAKDVTYEDHIAVMLMSKMFCVKIAVYIGKQWHYNWYKLQHKNSHYIPCV